MRRIFEAMQILLKYNGEDDLSVEHDQIWFSGPDPEKMKDDDLARLAVLRFRWEADMGWTTFV